MIVTVEPCTKKSRDANIDVSAAQTILNTAGKIVGRRQRLAARHVPVIVDCNQIGKRTANINRDSHEAFRVRLERHTSANHHHQLCLILSPLRDCVDSGNRSDVQDLILSLPVRRHVAETLDSADSCGVGVPNHLNNGKAPPS